MPSSITNGFTGSRKKSAARRLFPVRTTTSLRQRLDGLRQSRLVSRRRVLVHDLLVGDAVDHRLLRLEFLGRGRLVAAGDGLLDFLQRGAQRRLETSVVLTSHLRLPGTFARLGGVCHVRESLIGTVGALLGTGVPGSENKA